MASRKRSCGNSHYINCNSNYHVKITISFTFSNGIFTNTSTYSAILAVMVTRGVAVACEWRMCGARRPGLLGLLAATETSRQHTRLSQATHSCDSEAQRGSCITHLNATLMSESA